MSNSSPDSHLDFSFQPTWLGQIDYPDSLSIQERFANEVRGTHKIILLGLEYNKVITAGAQVKLEEVESMRSQLSPQGFQVYPTRRGGQLTLHSRGQLVIYPLMDLRVWGLGVKEFVLSTLATTAHMLSAQTIQSDVQIEKAGVYTSRGKIAFCGIRIDRGVSTHGISINVNNDLQEFKVIIPCGEPGLSMDTMSRAIDLNLEFVFQSWTENFVKNVSILRPKYLDVPISIV